VFVLAGLLLVCFATLRPSDSREAVSGLCLICGELGTVDAILNVALFAPLGVALGFTSLRWWKAIGACVLLTLLIESLQFATIQGRDASLGDLATNTTGSALGLLLCRRRHWLVRPNRRGQLILALAAAMAPVVVAAITGFSLQPRPTEPPFFGQLARKLSDDPAYPGTVLRTTLGSVIVPDEVMPEGGRVAGELRRGGPFSVDVIPREAPGWFAPVARIADRNRIENVVIAARDDWAIYSVRTNASFLRLRPYSAGIKGALSPTRTPVQVTGSFVSGVSRLGVVRHDSARNAVVRFGVASGWRLILPLNWVATGATIESLLDSIWLGLTLLPLGYFATLRTRRRSRAIIALGLSALAIATFWWISQAFGLPLGTFEIAGVITGIASGTLLSAAFSGSQEPSRSADYLA
jgi:hypothetical protein